MRRTPASGLAVLTVATLTAGAVTSAAAVVRAAPAGATRTASAATAVPTARLTAAGTVVNPMLFGEHYFGPDQPPAAAALVGTVRSRAALWYFTESAPGQFDFRPIDHDLAVAKAHGAQQVLVMLGQTPAWAAGPNLSSDPTSPTQANPPSSWTYWDDYVRAVATHLRGQPVAYQVWNEGSITTFWNGGAQQLARLTADAYRIIKQISPTAPVLAASSTMRTDSAFFPQYLRALGQQTPAWPVDAVAISAYPPSTGTPLTFQSYLRRSLAVMASVGASHLPLWVTEINYGLSGPGAADPHITRTGPVAQAWLARTFLDALRLGVQRVYWYAEAPADTRVGIQLWSGTPAMTAERTLYGWIVGARLLGCPTTGPLVTCSFARGAVRSIVAWSQGSGRTLRVPSYTRHACTLSGRCVPVRPGSLLTVNGFVTRLGP